MERRVQLLRGVFVVMDAQLVVVSRRVLPLTVRLHIKHLHEGANFHLTVLLTQRLPVHEEAVAHLRLRLLLRRKGLIIHFFPVVPVLAVFLFAVLSVLSVLIFA